MPVEYDADMVCMGAREWLRNVDLDRIATEYTPGLALERNEEALKRKIGNMGTWVTNEDGSGVALFAGIWAVRDREGKPVELKWDELASAGLEYRERVKNTEKVAWGY